MNHIVAFWQKRGWGSNRKRSIHLLICFSMVFLSLFGKLHAQGSGTVNQIAQDVFSRFSSLGSGSGPDTSTTRPPDEDSIHVFYYKLNHPNRFEIDTSVWEENTDMMNNPYYVNLGNFGTATKPIYFDITKNINLRTNIEAFRFYLYDASTIKYFQSDKPLTKLGYTLGPDQEQHYFAQHTRNITRNLNVALTFRLTSKLGSYKNQRSNTSNFSINSNYVSNNERFRSRLALIKNQIDVQENGGVLIAPSGSEADDFVQSISSLNDNRNYQQKKLLPVALGNANKSSINSFNNVINTGRSISTTQVFGTVSYDLGRMSSQQKNIYTKIDQPTKILIGGITPSNYNKIDSILATKDIDIRSIDTAHLDNIADSIATEKTFHYFTPKVRVEYSYTYNYLRHQFKDDAYSSTTLYYDKYYKDAVLNKPKDSIDIYDELEYHNHTIGSYLFLKDGITDNYAKLFLSLFNYEYKQKTLPINYDFSLGSEVQLDLFDKRVKSSIIGMATLSGWHDGDYYIDANFETKIPKLRSDFYFGLYNASRSAPFHFEKISNFYIAPDSVKVNWSKESILRLYGELNVHIPDFIGIHFAETKLSVNNFLFQHFFYFDNYTTPKQSKDVVNVLQVGLHNKLRFIKFLHYSSDMWFQTSSNSSIISIPTFITRQRLFVAGKAFEKQDVAAGLEAMIIPDYQAQAYSPVIAEWIYQNKATNSALTINAFVHFKIRSFFFYIRAEQLNTFNIEYNNGAFSYPERNNSMYVLRYFYPGLNFRFGFYWNLIN